jgi:hypothetical protein
MLRTAVSVSVYLALDSDVVGAAAEVCTGGLSPAECGWWQSFYDTMGGASWTNCKDKRDDPCTCKYTAESDYPCGVTCKGSHISGL